MILEKIKEDLVVAQKARDGRLVTALRLLMSNLNYKKIDTGELSPEDEIAVLRTEVKKRKESIEIYERVGDSARTEQEKFELELTESYLPKLMSEEEVAVEVARIATESGKSGGVLIGEIMRQLKGKADGGMVARLTQQLNG